MKTINKLLHKYISPGMLVFLPWTSFWSQNGSTLPDLSKVRVAVASTQRTCKTPEKIFQATLVKTNESRAKGLSGRSTPLAPDEAMLFVFERPTRASFWMKDTLIPLEIAFFDDRGRLSDLLEMPVEPDPSNPKARYPASQVVTSAIEVAPQTLAQMKKHSSTLCIETVR